MRAAVFDRPGPPEVLRYAEVPDPRCPRDGVVVEVSAVSLEGGDTLHRANDTVVDPPHIVGYQCAGTVREVGPDVAERHPGQRVVAVMSAGSHAELVPVPGAAATTWVVPDDVDLDAAATVPIPFGTAHDALFEFGRMQPGETVLVQAGASGVGLALVQLAKRAGATVIATSSSDEKLERLAAFGMDHGVNYTREDFVARVKELTGGRGADLVIDSVGGRVLAGSITAARYRGRIVNFGSAGRDEVPLDPRLLSAENKCLTGLFLGAELLVNPRRVHEVIAGYLADVAAGSLQVVVDRVFPLAEAAEAHRYAESRRAFGRILLRP